MTARPPTERPPEEARRRRRPRTPAGVPFATVERLVAGLNGVGDEGMVALRSRLHHFRRLDFPDGVKGGSGRHFDYRAADVLGVALAMELSQAFVPPAVVADIVRSGWPEFARAAAMGWREGRGAIVTVHPDALAALRGGTAALASHHVELAALSGAADRRRTIAVDVGTLAHAVRVGLGRIDLRSRDLADGGMALLDERFGTGAPLLPGTGEVGRLGGDGPYWRRAAELLDGLDENVGMTGERRLRAYLDYLLQPAPIDAWKTRVEIDPGIHDVGYAAALAWVCAQAGLRPGRMALGADPLEHVGRRMRERFDGPAAVRARLRTIAATAPTAPANG